MPDRPCVISSACGSTWLGHSARDLGPFSRMPPEGGFRVLSRRPVPPSATGPVSSVEVAAGPQARGGGGKCAGGQRRADRFRNHDHPLRITKRLYGRLSVGVSTRLTTMKGAWPSCNTSASSPHRLLSDLRNV